MDKPNGSLDPLRSPFRAGQIVVSEQGKDRGEFYVVVGFSGDGRLALADARRFNVSRPKMKNPKHVQSTHLFSEELASKADGGLDIDRGRLCQILGGFGKNVLHHE